MSQNLIFVLLAYPRVCHQHDIPPPHATTDTTTTTKRRRPTYFGLLSPRTIFLLIASLAVLRNLLVQYQGTFNSRGVDLVKQQAKVRSRSGDEFTVSLRKHYRRRDAKNSNTSTSTIQSEVTSDVATSTEREEEDEDGARARLKKNIPDWLASYMDWHRQIKPTLTPDNWEQRRYLVLRCLSWHPFRQRYVDRLRTFLFLLYLAQSDPIHEHRIFLLHWDRPAPLESFFVPPVGGLDWRVPDWLLPKLALGNESHFANVPWNEDSLLDVIKHSSYYTVVEFSFIFQLHHLVDKLEKQYRDCFNALFQPVPEVQSIVDKTKQELGLVGQKYTRRCI